MFAKKREVTNIYVNPPPGGGGLIIFNEVGYKKNHNAPALQLTLHIAAFVG